MQPLFRAVALALVVWLVGASAGPSAQTSDPSIGAWKLNLSKSKYEPGPLPKSLTRMDEDRGGGVKVVTVQGVDAQGNPTWTQFAHKYDGKDYPYLVRGGQTAGSISVKAVNANTVEITIKEDGKVVATATRTVSADGKTMTRIAKGTNAQGQAYTNVMVYERQ